MAPPFDFSSDSGTPDPWQAAGTTPTMAQGPTSGGGVMDRLQALIAPHMAEAAKAFPDNPIFSSDSHFAAAHPVVAHVLGNLLLAASQSHPSATPADAIRNIAGMVMAPSQYHRQMAMERAQAPYQMIQPQLAAEKELGGIDEAQQLAQLHQAQTEYYTGAKTDLTNAQIARQQELAAGQWSVKIDNKGNQWRTNATTGEQQPVGFTPDKGYQPNFNLHAKADALSHMFGGGLEGGIIAAQMSDDPTMKGWGNKAADLYTGLEQRKAGITTTARKTADQPFADEAALIARTPKPRTASPTTMASMLESGEADSPEQAGKILKQESQNYQNWIASTATRQGVSPEEYAKDPSKYPPKAKVGKVNLTQPSTKSAPSALPPGW